MEDYPTDRCSMENPRREGVFGSVEGTAGQPVVKGCSQLLAREAECWLVLFSKPVSFGSSLYPVPVGRAMPRQDRAAVFVPQLGDIV